MGVIVGILGVIVCVIVGFVGPGGPLPILFQPFELRLPRTGSRVYPIR